MDINELKTKISKTAQELELRELLVIKFLNLIASTKKCTSKELIRTIGLPQVHLYKLIHSFTDILEAKSKHIEVKKDLIKEIAEYTSKMIEDIEIDNQTIKNSILKYQKLRPSPDRNLDQFQATIGTVLRRVNKLAKNGDLLNKKIAFLGDDDLTSVATALTVQAKKITVFEIDDRLINLITQISIENNLDIEIVKQDLRQPLDKKYFDQFDIVFTDPPYTREGINIFLNQAIELISKNFLGRIYLAYGNSDRARERELKIQKLIIDHNLLIKTKIYQFNKYYGADSIGSNSSLYILDWTPSTKTIKSTLKKIYTND